MELLKDDEIAGKLRMIGPWEYDFARTNKNISKMLINIK